MRHIIIFLFISIVSLASITSAFATDSSTLGPQSVASQQYVCEKTASWEDTKWTSDYDCTRLGSIKDCDEGWVMLGVNFVSGTAETRCKTHCAKLTTNCKWVTNTP